MPEMRYNPITLDWVIMAPARNLKPDDFHKAPPVRPPRLQHDSACPFCPGNEYLTSSEICRASAADGSWTVRVIPNKFSAFVPGDGLRRFCQSTFRSMSALGYHEVVIEHPRHDLSFAEMEVPHLADILRIYRSRYQALQSIPHVGSVVVFKNQGERAGSSLMHPHSQIIAAPVISSQVRLRLQEARRFHELNGTCLYCQVMEDELESGERILEGGHSFVAFVPYAALSPYHLWIFPRIHEPSFATISDVDIDELAGVLSRQLRRISVAANDPDYNFTIRSAPVGESSSSCFRWYFAIVPRVNHLAGFELGSGSYINSLPPERCVELLRSVDLDAVKKQA